MEVKESIYNKIYENIDIKQEPPLVCHIDFSSMKDLQ